MKEKRLITNLISNLLSFALQMGISLILTPIIVEKVGDAAYGFVGLANNFVSYATVITVVINSMASRFITMELTKGNKDEANKYYSSVFIMNIIMSIIVGIASIAIIYNITYLLDIPTEIVYDVKLTFAFSFINLILSLINTVFTVATFAKDRLDLNALRNIFGNIIRAIILITLFSFLPAKIYYIVAGSIIMSLYLIISNVRLTKKLAPELKISISNFKKHNIFVLAKSGMWNFINSLSKILLTGLDLLIANVFINATSMGILSIAKTIPTAVENLLANFSNTFNPQFVILYSQDKKEELVDYVIFSLKITALIMIVPLAGFIAFGTEFFKLWLPYKSESEIMQIQILSVLSVLPYIVSASNYTLFVLDSVTNKLKRPVIATLIMSILSTVTTIVLLKTTNLGIYAIAGVSSVYWIIKVFFFNTINAAKNLDIKWYTFYKPFLKNLFCFGIILVIFYFAHFMTSVASWKEFLKCVIVIGIFGYALTYMILLNKTEKEKVVSTIQKKLKRK